MLNYDFLLNVPLKVLGLSPIRSSEFASLRYASYLYSAAIAASVAYGEYDFISDVYHRGKDPSMKAEGVHKYTYCARDVISAFCALLDLLIAQLSYGAAVKTEAQYLELDKILDRPIRRLRVSVVFFIIFVSAWTGVMLWYTMQMEPLNIYHGLSMTINTLDAFNIISRTEALYLRFSQVNNQLETLLHGYLEPRKIKDHSDAVKIIQRIRVLGDCHVQLCQMVGELSINYGFSMLLLMLLTIINMIAFSNWMLVSAVADRDLNLASRNVCLVILYFILAYCLLANGTKLIEESSSIQDIIWTNMQQIVEPLLVSELEILALKTHHRKYSINCGYYELSLDTFGPMVNAVLTQVVLLYTFQMT